MLLVSGSRVWVNGSVDDPVLGAGMLHGTGSQVARGVLAAALVGAAAVVAAATSGRVVRRLAAAVVVLAGVLGTAVDRLGDRRPGRRARAGLAATGTGRTGDVPAHGSVTLWVWVAALAGVVMTLGRRRGPGRRRPLERPVQPVRRARRPQRRAAAAPTPPSPEQAARRSRESAWEQLSRGEDPTAGAARTEEPPRS